jgi:predicted nuclease of predicted toxin-antitoxin system
LPAEPRFLLDENFSHSLGELLPRFEYAVQQVQRIAELGEPHPRVQGLRHKASDAEIADWCAEHDWILVTSDQDFRSRELRVRAYLGRGVDVILCTRQPAGLREQLELIVFNYPRWLEATAGSSRHPQLWLQHRRGGLKVGRT